MKLITVDAKNIDEEHICCALANDKKNKKRAETKKEWLKKRFEDGLVFKKFEGRGKFFIEYLPVEKAWKPVVGHNYLLINCLWVSGRYKGKGLSSRLLDACINTAKEQQKDGIVVVTSQKRKPFLTDPKFFKYKGFEVIDTAPPYFELLALTLNDSAERPYFAEHTKKTLEDQSGFKFIYSNQCPFMEEYVGILSETLKEYSLPVSIEKIETLQEAKSKGSPFGTFSLYYNGKFETHELMSEKRFKKYLTAKKLI